MSNSPIIWDEGQKARMLNQGPLEFFNGTEIWEYAGNPNTNVTAPKGSLVLDRTNGKIYINTDGATAYRDVEAVPDHNSTGNLDTGDYLHFTAAEKSTVTGHVTDTNNPHSVTKTQVGLGNVPDVDATNPANITQDANYRFVTDTEKGIWNGKQVNYATVAEAEAATPTEPAICYVQEKKAVYAYCASCSFAADGDLVLSTGNGGTTRWEMVQKMSRTQGDTGWILTDDATISTVNSTTARLAISTTAAIAVKSIRIPVPIGNYDITLSGTAGPKFVYFDDASLVLKSQDTVWDFNTQCPVMVVYWSGTAIVAAPQTEFHAVRDTVWHSWAHKFLGTQYVSGLSFTGSVQTDNVNNPGADDTVFYLWSTSGVIQDEDYQSSPGSGQWLQTLGSGLTSTTAAIFNFFYFNGSFITTAAAMADRAPFIHAGAGTTPQWNNGGTLTASVTGDYIVYHYFATPMTGGWSIFSRPHNAKFASLALALAASPTQLTWSNYAELKHIYTAVFRVNTGWSNTHLCKLVSLRDFRTVAGTPVAAVAPTAHASLSGLELAGAGVTWGHINDTTQTIAGLKTFTNGVGVGVVTPATELHVASTSTSSPRGIMSSQHNTGTDGARIHGRKSRGTNASPTAVASGDMLARWVASGYDGTNYLEMASIDMLATGTVASTRVPTKMVFNTATDAAPSVLTERMSIDSAGIITMVGELRAKGRTIAATAGEIGETKTSSGNVAQSTTNTLTDTHSVSCEKGIWLVRTGATPSPNGSYSHSDYASTYITVGASVGTVISKDFGIFAPLTANVIGNTVECQKLVELSSTTTIKVQSKARFSAGAVTWYESIEATRIA